MTFAEEFRAFGARRRHAVAKVVDLDATDPIDLSLMLAIGSRESGLRNIAGDQGHGRGFLQIDDRSHAQWLGRVRGCRSGEWTPQFDSALTNGSVPTLTDATKYASKLLQDNIHFAAAHEIPERHRLKFAVAAYNCGPGNALKAYRLGDVDRYTAGGNYSSDVLGTRRPKFNALLKQAEPCVPRTLALTSPRRMSGDDVRAHQNALNARLAARHVSRVEADGEWGPATDAANSLMKWLLGWPGGALEGATPEDQTWIHGPSARPQRYKAEALRRWDDVLHARRTRARRVRATIDWCRKQVGVHEEDGNNIGGKVCEWQRDVFPDAACGWSWCGAFVGYALKHPGKTPVVGSRIISVFKIQEDGARRRNGMAGLITFEDLKPGDLVIMDTDEPGPYNHVGISIGGGETIEGNTSPSQDFASNDGEGVYRKPLRPRASLSAFVRPTYGVSLPHMEANGRVVAEDPVAEDVFTALVHDMTAQDEAAILAEIQSEEGVSVTIGAPPPATPAHA